MAVDQHHAAAMTPEELRMRFARGACAEEFKASLPDGGARLTELESLVEVDRDASAFARLPEELNVLAIVEGWCRDSKDGSAVLLRLAGGRPNVRVRFFTRGEHPELMASYRKDGQFDSIPVLVFLDGEFNEIGRYVERPDEVTAIYDRHRGELAERNPEFAPADAPLRDFDEPVRERLRAALDQLRERDRQTANARIVAALEALAGHAAAGTHEVPQSPARASAPNPADEATPGRDQSQQEPDAGEACAIEW
jgi:hypothetical protein